ncbi:hypothetical protein FRC03_003400 [Tulasnella sp. 419]|nr:hypothetical protein FRC03_003400 [Tulasnella sp. 419]
MKGFYAIAAFIGLVPSAVAHYRWTALMINQTPTPDFKYVRTYSDTVGAPVTDVTSSAMRCNVNSQPVPDIAIINPSNTIGFKLDQQITHPGVINAYMAKVPAPYTAATWNGDGPSWFKVSQWSDLVNQPYYASTSYSFPIPAATPPGDYLVRIEHIALHAAGSFGGAQFHVACAQIKYTGTGTGTPGPLVSIPGVYNGNEPGILINIYWPIPSNYVQPGPPLWP